MTKLARLHKQQPSTAATLPESEYSFTLARVAVAQICQSVGFKGAQKSALEALTDIATRYLRQIAKLGAASANSNGRTQSNLADVIVALEDLASVKGFQGSSTVRSDIIIGTVEEDMAPAKGFLRSSTMTSGRRSLYTSAVIKDLMKFVRYADEIPFARPLPRRKFVRNCGIGSGGGLLQYDEGVLRHVPRWLPAVPVVEEKVKRKEKEREVKLWEEGCSERGKIVVERDTPPLNNEIDNTSSGKRAKVRFKMGGAVMETSNSKIAGNLRGVGIRKRVWCE